MMFWVIELISLIRTFRVRRIYALLKNETQKMKIGWFTTWNDDENIRMNELPFFGRQKEANSIKENFQNMASPCKHQE